MLQRYQGQVPSGIVVQAIRTLASFSPIAGTLTTVEISTHVPNGSGATVFDVLKNGVSIYGSPTDRPSIASGGASVVQTGLAVATVAGDLIEIRLASWPVGGFSGPAGCAVGVDDGIVLGTDTPLDIAVFVKAYYQGILARQPTSGELAAGVTTLTNGCLGATFLDSAQSAIAAIFNGAEYLALGTTNTQFVTALYLGYFNRSPDSGGLAFWVGQLATLTRAQVRGNFATHPEFINRAALYCRSQSVVFATLDNYSTVTYVTASLASGATANVSVPLGKFWKLYQIQADRAARIRFYLRSSFRTADAARDVGTDPTGQHGVIAEFVLVAGQLTWDCSPRPDGTNLDDPTSSNAFLAITNNSGATSTVTITLTYRLQ